MKRYLTYLWYILQHKIYVLVECWKVGLYWQGVVHDLSKLSPLEFTYYAINFFGDDEEKAANMNGFRCAWLHHQHNNKHHWNHWVVDQVNKEAVEIPDRYILEMVCDWVAMGYKFGDTAKEFFENNHHNMVLHPQSVNKLNDILGTRVQPNNDT